MSELSGGKKLCNHDTFYVFKIFSAVLYGIFLLPLGPHIPANILAWFIYWSGTKSYLMYICNNFVKSKMLGSMLALAVGEWLRAEGPKKSV